MIMHGMDAVFTQQASMVKRHHMQHKQHLEIAP